MGDDDEDIEQTHLSGRLLWAILVALPFGLGGCALAALGVLAIVKAGR